MANSSKPHRYQPPNSSGISGKWSISSRLFHWGSVLLLVITWAMIALNQNLEGNQYIALHKAFGVSLLFWMIARVINRLVTRSPAPLSMPKWQAMIAHLTHFALYGLLIAMPIAGVLMSVYGGRAVSVFGLFSIPVFVTPDRSMARFFNDLHVDIIWPMIIVFTLLHIGGALYHQLVIKDNLIGRMK